MPQDREELLREVIDKYAKMYMKFACDRGVPFADAEDVVMDAFWAFYNHDYEAAGETDEENEKALKGLLAKIVYSKCVDYYRKNCKFKTVSLDENTDEPGVNGYFLIKDPEMAAIEEEEYLEIRKLIEGMKEIWRVPAVMYFVEERPVSEICVTLGVTGTVCRSRISRARKHLKKVLKDYF